MKLSPVEKELLKLAGSMPAHAPLPATRVLGEKLNVSYTTVFRILKRFAGTGKLWQHPNGRFYPAAAQSVLDRPKPVACLTRRLELCSELYRELLEGISSGCGVERRTMLLWHDELLVNHHDPAEPPVFASLLQQRVILGDFLERHGAAAGAFVLDHLWSDEVLNEHITQLHPAVVIVRRCSVPTLSNIYADFQGGALQALGHLLGRGFETIIPVEPFQGDPFVDDFLATLESAARALGCADRLRKRASASTVATRKALIETVQKIDRRIALLCPEDNISRLLLEGLRGAGVKCPKQVGILSAMGTNVAARAGITCVRYDFRAIGRRAVECFRAAEPVKEASPALLVQAAST